MDILDIFWDILLKPPQPLMGLFFLVAQLLSTTYVGVCSVCLYAESACVESAQGAVVSTSRK